MLAFASAVLLGLLTGAMLLIACALVPFWQSVPPAEFRAWFAANSGRLGRVMIPLGIASALASVGSVVTGGSSAARGWRLGSAAAALGVGAITMLVNEPANRRFAAPDALGDAETTALLGRWAAWHWGRVALGLAGFYSALRALTAKD